MMTPTHVVGFLFSADLSRVILIRKLRPQWQKNLLNGVGGKIESGESSSAAMAREFKEETGYKDVVDWKLFCQYDSHGTVMDFYCAKDEAAFILARTVTDEDIVIARVLYNFGFQELSAFGLDATMKPVSNLRWLIPMAVNCLRGAEKATFEVVEKMERI